MCRLGWGIFCAFDCNGLPVGREFDGKFLKNVKSPPHALPPPPTSFKLIGAFNSSVPEFSMYLIRVLIGSLCSFRLLLLASVVTLV